MSRNNLKHSRFARSISARQTNAVFFSHCKGNLVQQSAIAILYIYILKVQHDYFLLVAAKIAFFFGIIIFWGLSCGFALLRLLPSVVELRPKGLVVALGLAGLLGPAALAAPWSGPSGHPAASLGRSTVFLLLAFFFGPPFILFNS